MPYIQVKQKYQVTIPTNVREAIGIHEGDTLEARAENGNIVLVPQLTHERRAAGKRNMDISQYIGSMKGTYGATTQEMDQYIHKERHSWD